jgi:hypothetical protein
MKKKRFENLAALLKEGVAKFKEAGRVYVEMINEHPERTTEIMRQDPTLTRDDLQWFEKVGKGEVSDAEILKRGLPIIERIQKVKFN